MKVSSIILAAGLSKRMNSVVPKVLHLLLGQPILAHCLDTVTKITTEKPVVVVGHGADEVKATFGDVVEYAMQAKQLGTADAVKCARDLMKGRSDLALVISADMPLLQSETLRELIDTQKKNSGPITMLTLQADQSRGFGRVLRTPQGEVQAVVEERVANSEQLKINVYGTSVYCFSAPWLWENINQVQVSEAGEYFLTDLIEIAVQQGLHVDTLQVKDEEEAIGINNRLHLAEAEAVLRKRINHAWMLAGVTMLDPLRVYIEKKVTLGKDTVLYPEVYVRGQTSIGEGCAIGPNVMIEDCQIGNRCTITYSVLEGAHLEDEVEMGPFGHLRKGAYLSKGVHMGNFGEIKNSHLAEGVKVGHFSYIGDATIGKDVNIGAGTITCNFDGEKKNRTEIGDNAFIGSDTMLVAPLKVGEGAHTGAGSVVTEDVPPHTTVVGVPAKPIQKKKKAGGQG